MLRFGHQAEYAQCQGFSDGMILQILQMMVPIVHCFTALLCSISDYTRFAAKMRAPK